MATDYFISKNRVLPPAQDYEFLKEAGMGYIEKLGNKFWTDYNPHDPGITILEVLAYVITELGYRNEFSFNNILSDKTGTINNQSFFSADKILTGAPVTEIDYRKLLIDIEGVSNAWFLATKKSKDASGFNLPNNAEKSVYINVLDDKLSFIATDSRNDKLAPLRLRGLNEVVVELDENPTLGDLNATITEFEFLVTSPEKWVHLTIVPPFTSWNDLKTQFLAEFTATGISLVHTAVIDPFVSKRILLTVSNPVTTHSLLFTIDVANTSDVTNALTYLNGAHFIDIVTLFTTKKQTINGIFNAVKDALQANRNLGEDIITVNTISGVSIGVCAKIELNPQTNATDVMAQVQIAINAVISPVVKFYTLPQLVAQGYHSEDIFLGPKLRYGFLKDEELVNSQLPTAIHTSDIIAAIMKIDGVAAISDVLLTLYDQNGVADAANSNKAWCLHLPGNVNATFSANKSKLQLYQKSIPFLLSEANKAIVEQKVYIYKALQKNRKLQQPDNNYPFPTGTFYQLDAYYSIQDEFPANYHVGKNKLPDNAPESKKAQVKQLQGYLYFYEQILADFFSQLYNAKDLLNINTIKSTYFPRFIEKDDLTGKPFYSQDVLKQTAKEVLTVSDNDQITLYETKSVFNDRRNRALDHLMARFSESFNDYVFMMYQVQENTTGLGDLYKDNVELIEDKQNFIASYPEISSKRAIAQNYTLPAVTPETGDYANYWDTSNIGGYARRAAKLLGINEWPLQPFLYNDGKTAWTLNVNNEILLFNVLFPEVNLADKKEWANKNMVDTAVYKALLAQPDEDGYALSAQKYFLYIVKEVDDAEERIIKIDKEFSSEEAATEYVTTIIAVLNSPYEYFYCLEHILLRPFPGMTHEENATIGNLPDLLSVCLKDDCNDEANNDPYSFKASIILPGVRGRFSNITFREYAEKILRQEAPAHVLLKICWVGEADMDLFKAAYNDWYGTYNLFRISESKNTLNDPIIAAHLINHRNLLKVLKALNTTYPVGNLYDCHLSEISNPIILGNTALGNL
jgi:hypothetical protein